MATLKYKYFTINNLYRLISYYNMLFTTNILFYIIYFLDIVKLSIPKQVLRSDTRFVNKYIHNNLVCYDLITTTFNKLIQK